MKVLWYVASVLTVVFLQVGKGEEIVLPGLGTIEGTTTTSFWNNKIIYQYQGIPFAQPPIANLRFKRPVKWTTAWTETRNFSSFGPICPQNLDGPLKVAAVQDEDCLTLNVYTTRITNGGVGTGHPVMVYIHGGSFRVGSAQNIQPNYLLDKDVILVVPQYRLGPLGFLSLKTEAMPGNVGMLDMVMALEWVQDNIVHFGGDPNRVTLFGQSAGAAAVTAMVFSPLVKDGLIQRIIAQSGSVLGTWATDEDPKKNAVIIAAFGNCTDTDETLLVACMEQLTAQEVLDAHTQFLINDILSGGRAVGGNHLVFGEAGEKSFLPEDPAILIKKGQFKHIPMMAGNVKHEGSWFLGNMYDLILVPGNLLDESPASIAFMEHDMTRQVLEYCGIVDRTGLVVGMVQDKYFSAGELGNFTQMTPGLIDIIGVGLLKASTFTMVKEMSRHVDSHMYSFNFFGRHSTYGSDQVAHYPFTGGIAHSDDLFYLFPMGKELDEREAAMSKIMVQLWANYAMTGVPSAEGAPEWPKISTSEGPYMKINSDPIVYDSFIAEEYTIAMKEGLFDSPSFAITTQASLVTILFAIATHLY